VKKKSQNHEQKDGDLIGMYNKRPIPCCGVSFGVDRIITMLKARREKDSLTKSRTDVFTSLLEVKSSMVFSSGIRTEFAADGKPKLAQQFKVANAAAANCGG